MSNQDFSKRIIFYRKETPKRENGNTMLLAFFSMSLLFSLLAFLIAILALVK